MVVRMVEDGDMVVLERHGHVHHRAVMLGGWRICIAEDVWR